MSDPVRVPVRFAVLVALLLPAASVEAHDSSDCSEPAGDFRSVVVTGTECTSPVGFCTAGTLTGDLEGSYDFVMLSMIAAPTTEHPARFEFTGYSLITTADGTMFGEDTGEIWFEGDVAFITHVGVVDGTECFDGVHGDIVAMGAIDMTTGVAEGTYTSTLCHAQNCFRRSDKARR